MTRSPLKQLRGGRPRSRRVAVYLDPIEGQVGGGWRITSPPIPSSSRHVTGNTRGARKIFARVKIFQWSRDMSVRICGPSGAIKRPPRQRIIKYSQVGQCGRARARNAGTGAAGDNRGIRYRCLNIYSVILRMYLFPTVDFSTLKLIFDTSTAPGCSSRSAVSVTRIARTFSPALIINLFLPVFLKFHLYF